MVRDAIAEMNGIDQADIVIDDKAKTATVGLDEGDPTVAAIVAHVAETRYKLKPRA